MKIIKLHTWEHMKNIAKYVDNTGIYTPNANGDLYIPNAMQYVFDEYYVISDKDYEVLQEGKFVYINKWLIDKCCIKDVYDDIKQTPLMQIQVCEFDEIYNILRNYLKGKYTHTFKDKNGQTYCIEVKEKRNEYATMYELYNNKAGKHFHNALYLCFYNVDTQHFLVYYTKEDYIKPAVTVQLDIPLEYINAKMQSIYYIYKEAI